MSYLLDTNACVSHLRSPGKSYVTAKLLGCRPREVSLCSVVKAELIYGAERSRNPAQNLAQVRKFFAGFASLPFDDKAAENYGPLRAQLVSQGATIGPNDLMIAAIALANNLTLVTHNVAEFGRVPGLQVEDWE